MYNKHTNTKTVFCVIVENNICIDFNTDKKRKEFIRKLNGRRTITCITNITYPWNLEDGIHNLVYPADFEAHVGIEGEGRVTRAIKNRKIKTEKLGKVAYIVEKNGHCYINGIPKNIFALSNKVK